MSWPEDDRIRSERKYSPSTEKVVPEEADNREARANANLFVDRLYHEMDSSEQGPNTFVPSAGIVTERYEHVQQDSYWVHFPEDLFTLREAYGASRRQLLFQKELAAERGSSSTSMLHKKNIDDINALMMAIELALPADQRPTNDVV